MPRNDPRTERGLAVARRMQDLTRKDGVAEALRKAQEALSPRRPAQESQAARMQRGLGMLTALGRRLTAAELRSIDQVHAMYGLPGVMQALADAGAPAEALEALDSLSQGGGLPAAVQAVRAEIQAEDVAQLNAAAAPDAAAVLSSLSDADMVEAVRIYNAGGPEALARRAVELGLHPAVATVAVRTLEAHGVDGARQAAAAHVQHQAKAAEVQAATERAIAKNQKDAGRDPLASLMADENFHRVAAGFYGDKAAKLEAAGLGLRKGESPGEWVIRMREQPAAKLAEVTGEPLAGIRAVLGEAAGVSDRSEVVSRLARSDAAVRKGRAITVPPERRAPETPRKTDGVKEAMEKAAKAIGYRDPLDKGDDLYRAQSLTEAYIATAAGHRAGLVTKEGRAEAQRVIDRRKAEAERRSHTVEGAMERAAAHLASQAEGAPDPAPERSESGGGMSVNEALHAAAAALGENDDD